MMASIASQTYPNIKTIVHSDDPRDEYVRGDVVINGAKYGPAYGNGTYNLYNNRLLKKIPDGPGWFHFIDDDDEYAAPDVIERLVESSLRDHVNVGRSQRWNNTIWPRHWGTQKSFQTECFFIHTDHKHKGKWWGNTGGDHHYSKQLTKVLPINWIDDLLICRAQEGKGHGRCLDAGGKSHRRKMAPGSMVPVIGLTIYRAKRPKDTIRQGEIKRIPIELAEKLERDGKVKITHWTTYVEKPQPINVYAMQ
ncbi:MAG: glycosyltransferase family 2 protein [Planctomycetaceae bacterium]|nr:MAG: glycosyltransferase family 2 protein [Planctomycetaceae bacterium]